MKEENALPTCKFKLYIVIRGKLIELPCTKDNGHPKPHVCRRML